MPGCAAGVGALRESTTCVTTLKRNMMLLQGLVKYQENPGPNPGLAKKH